MKKHLLLVLVFILVYTFGAKAQNCTWTYTINGNDVTFNHLWPLAGIYSLDSIRLDYGDNTTQLKVTPNIGANTLHTYPGPGAYWACITRYISSLGNPGVAIPCTYCDSIIIPATNNCFVTANYTNIVSGNTSLFTNTTSCAVCTSITYSWDFGDGSPLSPMLSPTHVYASPGVYVVCLIATGVNPNLVTCSDTFCTSVTIPPTTSSCVANAAFTFSSVGLTTNFTNTSTITNGTISSYSWNFGDGSPLSNAVSPSHTYANAGVYTVCLTVNGLDSLQNPCVNDTCIVVTVSAQGNPCVATANFNSTAVGNGVINFTNASTCTNCVSTTYLWNFGDGQTSAMANPTHTYATPGVYTVCLIINGVTATNQTCSDTICKPITVLWSGVKDLHQGQLQVYPNPASNQVWVEIPTELDKGTLVLQDLAGRILSQKDIVSTQNKVALNLQHLKNGIYILLLNSENIKYKAVLTVKE